MIDSFHNVRTLGPQQLLRALVLLELIIGHTVKNFLQLVQGVEVGRPRLDVGI
jgi:hypothetical protein